MSNNEPCSRRSFVKGAAVLLGAATASTLTKSTPALAQSKVAQSAVQYQAKPNGTKECANCVQFIPGSAPSAPGSCKVVDGTISPSGYCLLWTAKT